MSDWKAIWERKKLDELDLSRNEFDIFCDLKKADGFDVNVQDEKNYFMSFYKLWEEIYVKLGELSQNKINSVYEVGCGSGVNLFLFKNRLDVGSRFGGIDYSASLIDIARKVVMSDDLICGEAKDVDECEKYDLVMADSVFQYFENLDYAECVLRKMIQKTNQIVYLGELHDSMLREKWLEYRRSSMENYDEIYKGLPKLFYNREWIVDIANEYNKKALFTTSVNKEYWNSEYIFNCYIY